ncbi:MAG: hypothetical protein NTZ36_03565 [Candidatus Jorgensenbacteria bacterium]|nr:hypothetical protein [Candidatus Jorgensenbacteria bacterium]
MNNTKKALIISAFAVVAVVGFSSVSSALAYKGNYSVKGPQYTAERHDAMEKAFENNDYTAWKNLMQGSGRVSDVINKDNFAQFAKAHELAERGDVAGANAIRTSLGLGIGNGGCGMSGRTGGRGQAGR